MFPSDCTSGQLTKSACGCCNECARAVGESCFLSSCADGLVCHVPPQTYANNALCCPEKRIVKDTEDVYILDKLSMGWSVCVTNLHQLQLQWGFYCLGNPYAATSRILGRKMFTFLVIRVGARISVWMIVRTERKGMSVMISTALKKGIRTLCATGIIENIFFVISVEA